MTSTTTAILEPHIKTVHDQPQTWKGKTFSQIYAAMKQNSNSACGTTPQSLRKALPLKGYRRTYVASSSANYNTTTPCSNQRHATKYDALERPNGSIRTTATHPLGLVATLDAKETIFSVQNPSQCVTPGVCLTIPQNALTRVRTSGLVKPSYSYNTRQYLERRGKTFSQNQFQYTRTNNYGEVVFAAQGAELLPCHKLVISAGLSFAYLWLDGESYTVSIPQGSYDIGDLNSVLQQTMLANGHYLVNLSTGVKQFLLNLAFNRSTNQCLLVSLFVISPLVPESQYQLMGPAPVGGTLTPQFVIGDAVGSILGVAAGTYPATAITSNSLNMSYVITASTATPTVGPAAIAQVTYKPSNAAFSQDGGQMASAQTARLAFQIASALHEPNIVRTKTFPIKTTPVFSAYSSTMQPCQNFIIR